uniref:N-acetyltransferase domain-containing protein n=1 Tax=uncultured Nocardioidaceae bacterium TaxID=253824 RepID=A0A6J4MDW4_9ACTN|nr:MAG: hypothetical protein AVDCRST_MAG46-2977 [uncultured Nocardioidaceae bacterium]
MSIYVRPLDPWNDEEFATACAILAEAETHQRPYAVVDEPEPIRAALVRPSASLAQQGWMAWLDGRPAGMALAAWPVRDNLQTCWPVLAVAPALRRRGVGDALLAALTRAVRMAGRSVLQVEVSHPGGEDTWPGIAFAEHHGYRLALRERHSVLGLPVPVERLDAAPADDYSLRSWRDHCPDELVAGYCRLRELFEGEAPTGDLLIGEQQWSAERVRDLESRRKDQGRSAWTTVGVAPDDMVVGFTELTAARTARLAVQNQTLVLPDHRGHRLGLAMKAANLRRLVDDQPSLEHVHTWVSPDNTAMNDVNALLGFEPVELLDVWQLELSDS